MPREDEFPWLLNPTVEACSGTVGFGMANTNWKVGAALVCSKQNWALVPTDLSALPRREIQLRRQSLNTLRKAGIQYLITKVRVRLDRGFSPFSNLATGTNCCKARIRSISGKWLKGLPFSVIVYALLPMGFNYVHIQIQSGGSRSELGLAIHQEHRANSCHSLRTTAPLLPARGNSSERRLAIGRGRRRDSGPRLLALP